MLPLVFELFTGFLLVLQMWLRHDKKIPAQVCGKLTFVVYLVVKLIQIKHIIIWYLSRFATVIVKNNVEHFSQPTL